jgi:hypothetical protein
MLLCLKLSNGSLLFDQGFSALRSHLGTNSLACIAYTRESTVADRQEAELRVANIRKLLKGQDGSRPCGNSAHCRQDAIFELISCRTGNDASRNDPHLC